jgi:hypothetical protein
MRVLRRGRAGARFDDVVKRMLAVVGLRILASAPKAV